MPDTQAKSPEAVPKASLAPSRRRKPLLSIRARLIVVALVAIAPLMIDRVRSLERARVDRAELARTEVVDLARGGLRPSGRQSTPSGPCSKSWPASTRK